MLNRGNFNIKSLAYNKYSYANPGNKFYYNRSQNGATLLHSDFFEIYGTKTVAIKDNNAFDEQIYNIIKNWKYNYTPKKHFSDNLCWDLKIELSDDTHYRFKGRQGVPENFKDFEEYLNGCI